MHHRALRFLWRELLLGEYAIFRISMSIPILLFASYADAFGASQVQVPVRLPCRVHDLVNALRAMPGGVRLPPAPLVAVNRVWVDFDAPIVGGDEVALIPPVAGG